jgi:cob(I)alamin adenosyltransferase
VRLTVIYTRAGDAGETSLGDGRRVPKTDPRIEAYGTVDELNSLLGLVLAGDLPREFRPWLEGIQNDLFDLGADLSVPLEDERRERLRVATGQMERLEESVNPVVLGYLNRLSDLLFILARAANAGSDEPLWRPGGSQ